MNQFNSISDVQNALSLGQDNNAMPFWYVVPAVASIAAAANASGNITFDADSTFIWTGTTYFCDLAAAAITDSARPIPLITVSLTDTGAGRQFTSAILPIDTIASYKASDIYTLPMPRVFKPNATLRVAYNNYSTATTYTNLFMVLHGLKLFNKN